MYYFDKVPFTTNVLRKKVCVDISHFSVFSYRACAIHNDSGNAELLSISLLAQ